MRLGIALAGAALAVGALAVGAVALDVIEIPSLVEEDVAIEPLVEDDEEGDDGVPLEPLVPDASVPAGTDLAEAYRIEVRHNYTAAHDVGIAADTQAGDEYYVGDLLRAGDDRYEGHVVALATLDQTAVGMMGDSCHITWSGQQLAEAVGIVRTADSLPSSMIEGDDPGGVYLPIYITEPVGAVEWSDPDDDCGGVASEWLPISWGDPDSSSALGGAVPRLPPPGFGMVEERIEYTGPGFFGETTYTWVFTITPISADDVREPPDLTDEGVEIPPLVDE